MHRQPRGSTQIDSGPGEPQFGVRRPRGLRAGWRPTGGGELGSEFGVAVVVVEEEMGCEGPREKECGQLEGVVVASPGLAPVLAVVPRMG